MSTVLATPAAEPTFDAKAFMDARNKGAEPPKVEVKSDAAAEITEKPKADSSRSQRRAINNAIREAAEERGRRLAMEDMLAKGLPVVPAKEAPKADAEPKRADYAAGDEGMAEFLRASQKWDKAQEQTVAAKTAEQTEQTESLKKYLGEMDAKAGEDIKTLKDWDKVQAAAAADDDAPEFVPEEQPTLMALLARSDMRAFVLYHWAKPENYDSLQAILDMKDSGKQIAAFHRLEGKLEKVYDSERYETVPKAAQAAEPEKAKEDRTHLAEAARPGEPQQDGKPAKPKPSSEVTARGGSPAPDAPAIGSPAWMLERNRAQFGK